VCKFDTITHHFGRESAIFSSKYSAYEAAGIQHMKQQIGSSKATGISSEIGNSKATGISSDPAVVVQQESAGIQFINSAVIPAAIQR
jgi:hypothetical protein